MEIFIPNLRQLKIICKPKPALDLSILSNGFFILRETFFGGQPANTIFYKIIQLKKT